MKLKKKKWGEKSKRSLRDGLKRYGKMKTAEFSSKRFFHKITRGCGKGGGGGGWGGNELKKSSNFE